MNTDSLNTLLQGLPVSLFITFTALLTAFMLAILFTTILHLRIPLLRHSIKTYLVVFTGTPLLIQIFLIYYGVGQFPALQHTAPAIWALFSSPLFCAILALALNSAAYTTLLFHGAIKTISTAQWQATRALGLNQLQTFCILLPYALKRAIPAYSNEIILIFKATSLASTITIMDIMGYAKQLYGLTYDFSFFVLAGVIYLVINAFFTVLMRVLEKRVLVFEKAI